MDLKQHIVAEWATLKIEDAEIDLYGRDSHMFRAMIHEEARRIKDGTDVTPEESEKQSFARMCAMTKDIRGVELDGQEVKDPATLYSLAPGLYERAQLFLLSRANFLPKA